MKYPIGSILLFTCLLVAHTLDAQRPQYVHWDYRYGGSGRDNFSRVLRLPEGGFVMMGTSDSGIEGNKESPTIGGVGDYWIVRLDAQGHKLWDKTYGGFGNEISWGGSIITSDGGFLLAGHSDSNIGADKSQPQWGGGDYWVVKLDSLGNKEWDKTYGGIYQEMLFDVKECDDKGFILVGNSLSPASGDKTENNAGPEECGWVVKIDSLGNKEWDQTFKNGGAEELYMTAGVQTYDGGFVFCAATGEEALNDVSDVGYAWDDYWIVKTDAQGNRLWDKRFGGTKGDKPYYLIRSTDNGYVLVGLSGSSGTGVHTLLKTGYWIIKTDSAWNIEWQQAYHTTGILTNFVTSDDGGCLLSCYTQFKMADGDRTENSLGGLQTWVVKMDSLGEMEWEKTILTEKNNAGHAIDAGDGCYIIGASANGNPGGYKSQPNWDTSLVSNDFWILKLCDQPVAVQEPIGDYDIKVYPNPTNAQLHIATTTPGGTISLYNLLGGEALTQPLTGTHTTLDVSTLPAGVYVYCITQNGRVVYGKVLVE